MPLLSHSIKVLEKTLAELDELLSSGYLSPVAQETGQAASRDMHAMLDHAKVTKPCFCCGEFDVDSEAP